MRTEAVKDKAYFNVRNEKGWLIFENHLFILFIYLLLFIVEAWYQF